MHIVFFGSGAFGLPTLLRLSQAHDVSLVVTQPDRQAGRGRKTTPTPVAAFAGDHELETIKPQDMSDPDLRARLDESNADAYVVIAYGHKLPQSLIGETLAINLHASLLPKYRGAAPINWAIINGEKYTGVSVITLADRMDAGEILAQREVKIDPMETAGELHDRLASLGPEAVLEVLEAWKDGTLNYQQQDESKACRAPRLGKADGTVRFDQPAAAARSRIHGLVPWPGCTVQVNETNLKVLRVNVFDVDASENEPGMLRDDLSVACKPGALHLLSVQPAGGKTMTFDAFCRGRNITPGTVIKPVQA